MNMPFSSLLSIPASMTWFIDQCYQVPHTNQIAFALTYPIEAEELNHFRFLYAQYQSRLMQHQKLSETEISAFSEQLYHRTRRVILGFKSAFKQILNDEFYQKIRWISDAYLIKNLIQQLEHEKQISWQVHENLSQQDQQSLIDQLLVHKQKYLKRTWFFCLKPIWMQGLEALKQALFFLFPDPTLKWAIAYALYEECVESLKDAHQVESLALDLHVWTGIARTLAQSNTLRFFHVLIKGISSIYPDHLLDFQQFQFELTKNIFQRELMTQHQCSSTTQQAIELLQIIDHPSFLSLILNKLNAQKPSPIQYILVKQIFPILRHNNDWLIQAKSQLTPLQKQLIDLFQEANSPLIDIIYQEDEKRLFRFLNEPKKAFLQTYLSLASQKQIDIDDQIDHISRDLIKNQPNQFFKVLISLPLDILRVFLNENILSQFNPLILKSYLEKLSRCLVTKLNPRTNISIIEEKYLSLNDDEKRAIVHYHQLIDSKLIKGSFRDQRAILLNIFELLDDSLGADLFLRIMFFYQPSQLNARRLRRIFELCIKLKKIGISFEHLLVLINSHQQRTLKSLYEEIEYLGREALFHHLNLAILDHQDIVEGQSILDHPFLPIMLSLYANYAESVRLLEALKAIFIAMICHQYKEYKYQSLEQNQQLKLSTTQKHIWIKQQLNMDFQEGISHLKLRESDDYMEIAQASVFPIETCLSWRNGLSNRSLLSFIVDGHLKLVRFERDQKLIARAFWRLSNLSLTKLKIQTLVLVIEPIYGLEETQHLYEQYLTHSLSKAKQMHIPMVAPITGYEGEAFEDQRQRVCQSFAYQVKRTCGFLSLIGSITGYELSDTLSCFDLPQALTVEAEVFFFEPNWWEKNHYEH